MMMQRWIPLSTKLITTCLILVLSSPACRGSQPSKDIYLQLKNDILTNPIAVEKIPPKVSINESVTILLNFLPYHILYVNEAEMKVSLTASIVIEWDEPAFNWDIQATGIHHVTVSKREIWTPTLVNVQVLFEFDELFQSVDTDEILLDLPPIFAVDYTGKIKSMSLTTMTVSCAFDMEWYPFDEQRCMLVFIPANAESATINTVGYTSPLTADIQNYVISEVEWSMEEVSYRQMYPSLRGNAMDSGQFTYVVFEILLRRQSATFYITNLVFPASATAVLTLGVFLIPASSGEKVSYLVSIFISQTVFLSSVSSTMSKGDSVLCRFNFVLVAVTIKITLAVFATVFVMRRYSQEQKEKEQSEASLPSAPCRGERVSTASHNAVSSPSKQDQPPPLKKDGLDVNKDAKKRPGFGFTLRPSSRVGVLDFIDHNGEDVDDKVASEVKTSPSAKSPLSKVKVNLLNVWNSLQSGKRLSASALDMIFFFVFTAVSSTIYAIIMHAEF